MNPAFLFLPALLLFTQPSLATSWQTLRADPQMTLEAREPQADTSEASTADKEKKDRKLKVWSRTTHTQSQQAKPGDFYYTSYKTLWEVNCTASTVKPMEQVYYGDDGGESKHIRYGNGEKARLGVPDSEEEVLLDFACKPKQAKVAAPATPRKPAQPAAAVKPAAKVAPKEQTPRTTPAAKSPSEKPKTAAPASKLAPPLKPTAK